MDDIEAYTQERDSLLLEKNVGKVIKFYAKHNEGKALSYGEAELIMHKAITGARTLPIEFRRESKQWLEEHGWSSLDDGDL